MRLWMLGYVALTLFDVLITFFFVSSGEFGIEYEANPVIRGYMEQYGIAQGLAIYFIQDLAFFCLLWVCFYYIFKILMKDRSEELQYKIDMIVFNIGVPFIIMASALMHLLGGVLWIGLGIAGYVNLVNSLQLIIYIMVIFGIVQAYYVFKLNAKVPSKSDQPLVPE